MDNIGKRTSLLTELSGGNLEFGKAFALTLNDMLTQSGLRNPKSEIFEIMPPSWKKLSDKKNKTSEENAKLAYEFNNAIRDLAKSYLFFIARETGNLTGKIDYAQYETYMMKYRFGHYSSMNKPEYLAEIKPKIRNAFDKICSHGEEKSSEKLIDKEKMAEFLYALTIVSNRTEENEFNGFKILGTIDPREFAVNEHFLFEKGDNMFSLKLKIAHNMLNKKQ